MIFDAVEFATKAHSGQYRKGTNIPYIVHPLGVSKILIECDAPDHLVIAGILHDTVEDTDVRLDEIKQIFGNDVAHLVEIATEPNKLDKRGKGKEHTIQMIRPLSQEELDDWVERKKHTIAMINTLSQEESLLVLADKLDNIRAIREDYERDGERIWTRFNAPKECQKWYYEGLVAAFTKTLTNEQSLRLLNFFRDEVTRVFGNEKERG